MLHDSTAGAAMSRWAAKLLGDCTMWTDTAEGKNLVADLTRTVVAEVGPEEIAMFDDLLADYFRNPRPEGDDQAHDDPLGFGFGAIALITPAAAAMVIAALKYLGSEAVTVARDETAQLVKMKIAALFRSSDDHRSRPAPLAREQLDRVRRLARKEAEAFGLEPAIAEQMAKALVGALVLAK
jgi:hypothetical protein